MSHIMSVTFCCLPGRPVGPQPPGPSYKNSIDQVYIAIHPSFLSILVNLYLQPTPGYQGPWALGWRLPVSPESQDEVRARTWMLELMSTPGFLGLAMCWDYSMLYQGKNVPQKGTAKGNNCPRRQSRENTYIYVCGSSFSGRKSIENSQMTVPQMLADFPHSTTPTSIHFTGDIIS